MKKIICKVEYDTENAELIKKVTNGEFGDPKATKKAFIKHPQTNIFFM